MNFDKLSQNRNNHFLNNGNNNENPELDFELLMYLFIIRKLAKVEHWILCRRKHGALSNKVTKLDIQLGEQLILESWA
jgi:hypothetical protein